MVWVVIPIVAAITFALWFSPLGEKAGLWSWPKPG
jgi:hypothetical protein